MNKVTKQYVAKNNIHYTFIETWAGDFVRMQEPNGNVAYTDSYMLETVTVPDWMVEAFGSLHY